MVQVGWNVGSFNGLGAHMVKLGYIAGSGPSRFCWKITAFLLPGFAGRITLDVITFFQQKLKDFFVFLPGCFPGRNRLNLLQFTVS